MKILILSNKVPYPPIDGGSIATLSLINGFANTKNDVTVFSMNTNKHYCNLDCISNELKNKIRFCIVDVPAKITMFGALKNFLFSRLPYNAERFIDENFRNKLVEHLKTNTYDVIQLEGLYLLPYVEHIRKFSKALLSYRAHNIEYEIWERVLKLEISTFKKFYLKSLVKRLKKFELKNINNYDVIVPITKRDDEKFTKLLNTKPSFVSMTGIDIEKIKIDDSNTEYPSLFHLGALDWAPNQEGLKWFFDNVWQKILDKMPNLKIHIAGRNAPEKLKNYLISQKNTVFLGEIDDAHQFINSKAVMIVPLFSGSGLRIKIIEGLALGKVIVSTSIGAEGIDIENNKNILIADDTNLFAEKIIYILNDKEKFNSIKNQAIEFSRNNFDNNVIANKLLNFYEKNLIKK